MAFRNVFGFALVLGGVLAVGCGGTSGRATHDLDDDPPPSSGEQPPASSDQPPASTDRPPTSSERPSSNPDRPPGGGSAESLLRLCRSICAAFEQCETPGEGLDGMDFDELCSTGCTIPAGTVIPDVPCLDEMTELFDCALGAGGLCAEEANEAALAQCESLADSFESCQGTAGPIDEPGQPLPSCTAAGGCECETECETCACEAGNDVNALMACGTSGVCAP